MSSPVRLSRSRRILSRSGSRSSSASSLSSSKFATPRASVHDDLDDDYPDSRPSPTSKRSTPPQNHARSRRSRTSASLPSRHRSSSRSSDGAPGHSQEARQSSPARLHPPKHTRFGLSVPTNQPRVIGRFDFEEMYPEDPVYEELGPNARVWRANLDECEVYDNDMVTEARDGLDLMLVFAGLFSAVLTTFVAQTSQALSNNFPAVSTALLLEMVALQRALINGTPTDDISASEMSSGPSGFDIWVNVLWFTSLTLSLGTALMAVLVKQWLYQYMSIISGTARDRSLIRFYRFDGLRKWHVLTIIGTLPIMLHVALGLFLAGLVVFLIPLNTPLAVVIGFITLMIYSMYAISNILPILYTQCPYRTPFSDILNAILHHMRAFLSSVDTSRAFQCIKLLARIFLLSVTATSGTVKRITQPIRIRLMLGMTSAVARAYEFILPSTKITRSSPDIFSVADACSTTDSCFVPKEAFRTLKEMERMAAISDTVVEEIASDALSWLYQVTSNPPTKNLVLQSIGCLSDDVTDRLTAITADLDHALAGIRQTLHLDMWTILPGQETRAERLLRSNRHNPFTHFSRPCIMDKETCEHHIQLSLSLLTHTTTTQFVFFTSQQGRWGCKEFFIHILLQYDTIRPVLFPSVLWQRLLDGFTAQTNSGPSMTDMGLLFKLGYLGLQSLRSAIQADEPFSAGVPITHRTVFLPKFVIQILPPLVPVDSPDIASEPLLLLLTLNDFILTQYDISSIYVIVALRDIWNQACEQHQLSPGDRQALCHRAEQLILQVFVGGWWGEPHDLNMEGCYSFVLRAYRANIHHAPSHAFFNTILADLGSQEFILVEEIFYMLKILLSQFRDPAYFILFCESSLFSPKPAVSLYHFHVFFNPIFLEFTGSLARGDLPTEVPLRCMDYLCEEPDRLFTICRVLALGDGGLDSSKHAMVQFASIAPTHTAWKARAHYMSVNPQDWPYLRPQSKDLENEVKMIQVTDRMQAGLAVLDEFFASFNNSARLEAQPMPILEEPNDTEAISSVGIPLSPWRRVRHVVTSFQWRAHTSHGPAIELSSPALSGAQAHSQDDPSDAASLCIQPGPPTIPPFLTRLRGALSPISRPSLSASVDVV